MWLVYEVYLFKNKKKILAFGSICEKIWLIRKRLLAFSVKPFVYQIMLMLILNGAWEGVLKHVGWGFLSLGLCKLTWRLETRHEYNRPGWVRFEVTRVGFEYIKRRTWVPGLGLGAGQPGPNLESGACKWRRCNGELSQFPSPLSWPRYILCRCIDGRSPYTNHTVLGHCRLVQRDIELLRRKLQ